MQKAAVFIAIICALSVTHLHANEGEEETIVPTAIQEEEQSQPSKKAPSTTRVSAFTGKITKNKVRMRLQPNLESIILRELNNKDMVVITGESDDFFAVQPPGDIKGYVFRTYVLDGVVEGNHVNVRLEPDLSSPIIAQLNSGDRINGSISPRDKKWFEISLPESTQFYIAKEYIEKIGDAGYMARFNKRRDEVSQLLTSATRNSQTELQKPFNQINIEPINKDLNKIVAQYSDFTDEAAKAKELLTTVQTAYLSKKVAYMESQPRSAPQMIAAQPQPQPGSAVNARLAAWLPSEQTHYEEWKPQHDNASMDEFYTQQNQNAVPLKGVVEAYTKPIKNRPGDYLLVHPTTHLPIAYLYSTQVNLENYVGQEIALKGAVRNNHHFAYPAYFVLSVE